ncbi:MA3 DOMAIN-CONTAINING TRANSLATION REGULATORY FACTOR 2-like isoform X2 [Spinacia oleracea]|uniref:MA3 DOMAIN-CONTAINING TRANSLATION REGULATORY FACTOR 2-like isoform X2 n=1 Tax=Spinacia oleracea TaxID=3562 RepID=A0A9R0IGW3_SPIOL|nr:MA3 DOMAIN-CONTAINING TRANSLATION REGULATORY FACTOR 2-like isoform X2 [Spinacia oleracea]
MMELKDHVISKENQELLNGTRVSVDPYTAAPLQVATTIKPHGNLQSYSTVEGSLESTKESSPKGGVDVKEKCRGISNKKNIYIFRHDDFMYNNNEDEVLTPRTRSIAMEEYRKKSIVVIEEYFANDDVVSTTNELRDLGMPNYDYYFVKKLVSMAMDKHAKEKEMAAVLLSSLYADAISPSQIYKGFSKLVECVDDLIVDIPNVVDTLALFIARAIIDDILPPIFLTKQMNILLKESKGVEVIKRVEKGYLSVPYHTEIIENKWGGSKNKTAEDIKAKISTLLTEFVVSGDKKEACRCIKELNVPYFHHEIMKRALLIAMEKRKAEGKILELLRMTAEEGLINSSQINKGFNRMIDTIDDLSLDIPNARRILQSLISKCASEGWLPVSSLKSFSIEPKKRSLEEGAAKSFKSKAQAIIQEYFLSRDTMEVYNCLESENCISSSELNVVFVKRLINLAMDRKNKEKEMASILLSSLSLPAEDVANGFIMLIESADDTSLDNPIIVEDLVKFLARAVIDEVITPSQLADIGNQIIGCDSIGNKIIQMTKSLLKARLCGERILRCWGGEGSRGNGWTVDDVKDKIGKLLEEYECGGGLTEAFRCIKELGMPFFHHEVVKKALVIVMEKKNERMWNLLQECFTSGLITMNQMTKGFARVEESLDDLALDVPDAKQQFSCYIEKAKSLGWMDPSYFYKPTTT